MSRTATATQARPLWSPILATVVGTDVRGAATSSGCSATPASASSRAGVRRTDRRARACREDPHLRTIRTLADRIRMRRSWPSFPPTSRTPPCDACCSPARPGSSSKTTWSARSCHRPRTARRRARRPGRARPADRPAPAPHREKQILSLLVLGLTPRDRGQALPRREHGQDRLGVRVPQIGAHPRSKAIARIQDPESGSGSASASPTGAPVSDHNAATSPSSAPASSAWPRRASRASPPARGIMVLDRRRDRPPPDRPRPGVIHAGIVRPGVAGGAAVRQRRARAVRVLRAPRDRGRALRQADRRARGVRAARPR